MLQSRLLSASLIVVTLAVLLSGNVVTSSQVGSGVVTFTVYGYTVNGVLTGAAVGHGGGVQMLMAIDQAISIPNGTVHVAGNGVWSGTTNLQTLNGEISNVQGSVQACLNQTCQTANFSGDGTWAGSLTWSKSAGAQGTGTYEGALTFTGSQINQTGPVPISGNWTASFAA
jgi:putative copper export protein